MERRRGGKEEKCCKYYQVEAELAVRKWNSPAGISTMRKGFMQSISERCF